MAFNQLLWSLHGKVINKLREQRPCEHLVDVAPHTFFPKSTKVYIEIFEAIIERYKYLEEFVDLSSGHCDPSRLMINPNGLYLKAFCNGISSVLQDINHTFMIIEQSFLECPGISMPEILDKFENLRSILEALNSALKEVKDGNFPGCTIIDLCENIIRSSGEAVESAFRQVQQHCLKQFYAQIKLWILQAELYDPYEEFFISPDDQNTSIGSTFSDALETSFSCLSNAPGSPRFQVNPNNLPSMISLSVAMKIIFIGEALTICLHNDVGTKSNDRFLSICGISEQLIISQLFEIEKKGKFSLQDFSCLIDDLWLGVNKYIRQVSDEVGNVNDQLILMWEIYLLGRGELFQEFLLKGSLMLSSDVTIVDSRNLNKVFKDAVYYVYLTENSDISSQFYFKLPHKKALKQGTSTWSNMSLMYKIKWPLQYLFTQDVIHIYNRLFCFLLRLKKAQIDTTAWKNISSIRNHSLRMELIEVRMHLLAIVGNLQNYCFTNVIANEMTVLLDSVNSTTMFTDLQKALSLFLTNISNRLFLPGVGISGSSTFDRGLLSIETVNKCFRAIFTLCGLFSELDGKDDEYVSTKLKIIKSKLQSVLKKLFSLLQKIDQTYYCDGGNSMAHLYSLMMCLDYNGFFRNKFNLDP